MPEIEKTNALKPLNEKEKALLISLMKPDSTVDVAKPDNVTPDQLWSNISVVCRGLARLESQCQMLIPVLGKLLCYAKDNPAMYRDKWTSFEAFKSTVGEEFGVHRSTIGEAMMLVRKFAPAGMELSEYRDIGRRKLGLLSKAIPNGAVKERWAKGLLEKSKTLTETALREHCEEKGWLGKGESTGAVITIHCTKALLEMWRKFLVEGEIIGFAGTDREDKLLELMMDVFRAEASEQVAAQTSDANLRS